MQAQPTTSPAIPVPMPQILAENTRSLHTQPICPRIPPNIQPVPILPRSNHNTAPENNVLSTACVPGSRADFLQILSSTSTQLTADRQPPPQEVTSPPPASVNPKEVPKELGANIPPPPGLTRRVQQQPHIPEIISRTRTPTSAGDLMDPSEEVKVSIPSPPGLPRRGRCYGGRFGNRGRVSQHSACRLYLFLNSYAETCQRRAPIQSGSGVV